jgi:O-antigen/teichoic acid export membrane protein
MDHPESRTRARTMVAGVAWNAAGRGLPLILALLLTPFLVHELGVERWGLFTLALAMFGVFGVFDFGVGQALTRALAERMGRDDMAEAPALVAAALVALTGFSALAAAVLFGAIPLLVESVLNVPPALHQQAIDAMRVLVAAAPLVVLNAALWGVLAAWHKFRAANLVSIPVSIFYYLGPVLVLLVWDNLAGVMLALVACRLANTVSYALLARPLLPGFTLRGLRLRLVVPLLKLGGWMTFSGTLSQVLLYADRFLIGALLTLAAVAYYSTPLDLVLRMWILPVAVAQTLLPALAASYATDPARAAAVLRRGALIILSLVFPACLVLVGGAELLLRLWLGADFAVGGGTVLRILGVGILFSCVAFAPNALIDAIGRPDLTARLGLLLAITFLPLSAAALWLGFGIEGAAAVWALRAACDCAAKLWLGARAYPGSAPAARQLLPPLLIAGAGLVAVAALRPLPALEAAVAALALLGFALALWRAVTPTERDQALIKLRLKAQPA